jgi:hypothetical protein
VAAEAESLHWVVDGLGGIIMAVVSWVMKGVRDDHKDLADKHEALAAAIPETYARRDDMKDTMLRVEAMFTRIEAKLDRKADK